MAELDVQPKKSSSLIWILLIIVILALLFFLVRGCNNTETTGASGRDSTKEKVSIHSLGESAATATNSTGEGRKLNRSVRIVALADKK